MASSAARHVRHAAGIAIFLCVKCFLLKPHFDLEPDCIIRRPMQIDSNYMLCIRKYCQLFTHESNTFLNEQYVILPIQVNRGVNAE